MSWLLRGIQSAVFHYASCAPCIQRASQKKRRKQAKADRKARIQLEKDQPGVYAHPEPTGTNPFWQEEIDLGPGPPPRRAKRTNTSSQRGIVRADTHSTIVSQGGSSIDVNDSTRLSDETLDDDNWNRKRYQREDEYLWGLDEPMIIARPSAPQGSSVGVTGISRPGTSKSSAESYYTARVPPVNDLHPPVVSLPSPHATDNQWMLQPPPKARVMSGKERATRSRSGSGASSRVELSLQRQLSARQIQHNLELGGSSVSGRSSYSNLMASQRHEPRVPPLSASSSRSKKRRDTVWTAKTEFEGSSEEYSSDTPMDRNLASIPPSMEKKVVTTQSNHHASLKGSPVPSLKVVHVRSSRQRLSTVVSSGETRSPTSDPGAVPGSQANRKHIQWSSTQSSDSIPYLMKHRAPLTSSDRSSLNVLQELAHPRPLLNSRFVSAPLVEARIRLPPQSAEEENTLSSDDEEWVPSGFGIRRQWTTENYNHPVPFDSSGVPERDPRLRWSVDF